jgi:uncharacterized FlaG/YvyC family protein
MKAASLSQIKSELKEISNAQLLELCLRMARYKKENKELLDYLLFDADDESNYVRKIKEEMQEQFAQINKSNIQYAKKSLQKILRLANKYIKFSGKKQTEVEIRMHFCLLLKESGIRYHRYQVLQNQYDRQIDKIRKAIASLHEDLQYDYERQLEEL